jgi:hypothetical protein
MPNPYFDALGKPPRDGKPRKPRPSPSHQRAKKQEKETSLRAAAQLTPASGSRDVKGDVRKKRVARIECKTTKHASFSVTLDMVRKLEEAALSTGEMPIFEIEFNNGAGKKIASLVVMPGYALDLLCDL